MPLFQSRAAVRPAFHPIGGGAAFVALCVAWTLFAGKDIGWDLLNHHLYLPFSLLSGRFETDLYAAGPQSYQNPIGYVPFYLLAQSAWPSWWVGICLAVMQGVPIAWALARLSSLVLGDAPATRMWRVAGLALAFVAPIFLYCVGTSSNDPLCTALLLVSLAIVLDASARLPLATLAGVALGLAVAIKPTSLVIGLPILALVASRLFAREWRLAAGMAFALSALVTFSIAGGLWGYWLWQHYGSPTFPLFNNLFHSPLAPAGPTSANRFLPEPGWSWIARLWQLALIKPFVMVEAIMPDIRPLLASIGLLTAGVVVTRRRGWSVWARAATWLRPDVQLALVVAIVYLLWLMTSGNARYAIGFFLLVGLVLARAVQACWASRWALPALFAVAAVQFVLLFDAGDHRTLAADWDRRGYVPVQVPKRLVEEPVLHLSLGVQSYAGIAPFLHPKGAFVNLKGQVSLPVHGPLGDRLKTLMHRWEGRTRFLFAPPFNASSASFADMINFENRALSHDFGLRIDREGCLVIRLMPSAPGSSIGGQDLLSCPAVPARHEDPQLDRDLAVAAQVFKAIETACPRVFGPSPMTSDHRADLIWRRYTNTDSRVDVSKSEGVILSHFRATNPVRLGSIEQVLAMGGHNACAAWKQLRMQ